jgi:hypothetical protein
MNRYAFVDESGNEGMSLDMPQVSSHYVVTALIVNGSDLAQAEGVFAQVRDSFFHGAEMKSVKIRDPIRRRMVVHALAAAPFDLCFLVADKRRITSAGLRYPKSFIKYLQGRLYKELLKDTPHVHVRADEIKGGAFTDEFRRYLEKANTVSLFSQWTWEPVKSTGDVGVQAADVIGGTIRMCFEDDHPSPFQNPLFDSLHPHLTTFFPFPEGYAKYLAVPAAADPQWDYEIEIRAVAEAEDFLLAHEGTDDPDRRLQVACLRLLLSRCVAADTWVPTHAISACLNAVADEPVTEQALRGIIGRLRDQGVLISSRTAGGYKLPTSYDDVIEFLNRQNSQIAPMLSRVRKARDTVRRATRGTLDILRSPEYSGLKAAVEVPEQAPS